MLLRHIHNKLDQIIRNQEIIMATQADLNALTASITTQITTLGTDLTTAISDIKAQLPVNSSIDLTGVQSIADKLTAFDATIKADDPGAPTPTTPVTPTT